MTIDVLNKEGKRVETLTLPKEVFSVRWNPDAVHQAVVGTQTNARSKVAHAKGRGEVSGGGKKPWRQKGTGRARHGSIRSPIWKGGGVTFGPQSGRVFSSKVNKKMKRFALASLLSRKLKDKKIFVFDSLTFEPAKTKTVAEFLRKRMGERPSVLFIRAKENQGLPRAARNIPRVDVVATSGVNILACVTREKIVFEKGALLDFIARMVKEPASAGGRKK